MQCGAQSVRRNLCMTSAELGSNKCKKAFILNGLEHFEGTHSRGPIWTMTMQKAFPCSVAPVLFFDGAFPCSAALVFQLWTFLRVVQLGLSEGVRNIYKTNAFLLIFKFKGAPGAASKRIQKNNICEKDMEK